MNAGLAIGGTAFKVCLPLVGILLIVLLAVVYFKGHSDGQNSQNAWLPS